MSTEHPASPWIPITYALPGIEVPVWLYCPQEHSKIIVGCRSLPPDSDGWLWAECYDDFHWYNEQLGWGTDTEECDDLRPTHWMPLPYPPRR